MTSRLSALFLGGSLGLSRAAVTSVSWGGSSSKGALRQQLLLLVPPAWLLAVHMGCERLLPSP